MAVTGITTRKASTADDSNIWNGWHDGDNRSDDPPEQSTSHLGTENEKKAVFQGNRVIDDISNTLARGSQNGTFDNDTNSTGLGHTCAKDLEKNVDENQDTIESQSSPQATDQRSNVQHLSKRHPFSLKTT